MSPLASRLAKGKCTVKNKRNSMIAITKSPWHLQSSREGRKLIQRRVGNSCTTRAVQNCSVFEQPPMEIRGNFVSYSGATNSDIQVMKINRLRGNPRPRS